MNEAFIPCLFDAPSSRVPVSGWAIQLLAVGWYLANLWEGSSSESLAAQEMGAMSLPFECLSWTLLPDAIEKCIGHKKFLSFPRVALDLDMETCDQLWLTLDGELHSEA